MAGGTRVGTKEDKFLEAVMGFVGMDLAGIGFAGKSWTGMNFVGEDLAGKCTELPGIAPDVVLHGNSQFVPGFGPLAQ